MSEFHGWPHTENLSAAFVEDSTLRFKIDVPVVATEKLDGSNMSLQVRFQPKDDSSTDRTDLTNWVAVGLQGRKQHIWTPVSDGRLGPGGEKIPVCSYGNAGSLGNLPNLISTLAVKIAQDLGIRELVIYGEAFRVRRASGVQKTASFHPFGYVEITRKGYAEGADPEASDADEIVSKKTHGLCKSVHDLFSKHAMNGPASFTNPDGSRLCGVPFQDHLFNTANMDPAVKDGSKDVYVIAPPPIVYHGPLKDGADTMHTFLVNAAPSVEGVFLCSDVDSFDDEEETPSEASASAEPSPAQSPGLPRTQLAATQSLEERYPKERPVWIKSVKIYCKWKSPIHEEQMNPQKRSEVEAMIYAKAITGRRPARAKLDDYAIRLEKMPEERKAIEQACDPAFWKLFNYCVDLHDRRKAAKASATKEKLAKLPTDKDAQPERPEVTKLKERVLAAFKRELTKDPALALGVALPEMKARKALADRVVKAVSDEVKEQMKSDGEKLDPALEKVLARESNAVALSAIMKGQLDEYR